MSRNSGPLTVSPRTNRGRRCWACTATLTRTPTLAGAERPPTCRSLGRFIRLPLASPSIPRWLGWSGAVLAAVGLIGTATLLDASLYPVLAVGTLLFDAWVGV